MGRPFRRGDGAFRARSCASKCCWGETGWRQVRHPLADFVCCRFGVPPDNFGDKALVPAYIKDGRCEEVYVTASESWQVARLTQPEQNEHLR